MAAELLSNASTFLPSLSSSSTSSTSSIYAQNQNVRGQILLCKTVNDSPLPPKILSKRNLSISLTTAFLFSLAGKGYSDANAAILQADDDIELLEKVKKDRKKRLEKQSVISSSNKDREYLQDIIYKLSKVGQAIENNDLFAAGSVLGQSADTDWVQKANVALTKLSSSAEEKTEVDTFKSSLAALASTVVRNDIEASKIAFVASASAFEKWTTLTGLIGQLKGL